MLLTNQDVVGTNMNAYKFTVDTPPTDGNLLINQFIEEGAFTLIGKTVTASWYARQSTGSGVTSNINFEVDGGVTFLGTGSANTLTSSWQRFTQTFTFSGYTAASVSNSSLRTLLYFKNTAASDVIEVTGVQLELGSVATDFEHRSYGEELALCKRYYQIWNTTGARLLNGFANTTTSAKLRGKIDEMRVAPTCGHHATVSKFAVEYRATAATFSSIAAITASDKIHVYMTVVPSATLTAGDGVGMYIDSTGGYFDFDAEL